jgi:hypothetical protein
VLKPLAGGSASETDVSATVSLTSADPVTADVVARRLGVTDTIMAASWCARVVAVMTWNGQSGT